MKLVSIGIKRSKYWLLFHNKLEGEAVIDHLLVTIDLLFWWLKWRDGI